VWNRLKISAGSAAADALAGASVSASIAAKAADAAISAFAAFAAFAALTLLTPGSALAADPKQDPAEAAAAMERAKRMAANPLRVILEASKVKRRVTPDTELASATGAQPTTVAAGPVAVASTAPGATGTSSAPTPVAQTVRADDVQTSAPRVVAQMRTLHSAPAAAAGVAGLVPAMQSTDQLALPEAVSVAAMAAPALAGQPKLIDMVEPSIPQRVLDEIGKLVEITADLTIRADGTVAGVTVRPPVPRQLVRYVVSAMERWRFAPLPSEQLHRVQLVFNDK